MLYGAQLQNVEDQVLCFLAGVGTNASSVVFALLYYITASEGHDSYAQIQILSIGIIIYLPNIYN